VHVTFLEKGLAQSEELRKKIEEMLTRTAPAHAEIKVIMLTRKKVEISFTAESEKKDDPGLHERIRAALTTFFAQESVPGGFLDAHGKLTPTLLPLSRISAVISAVEGEDNHTLLEPKKNIRIEDGELLTYEG
jgi:hypothetical protein